MALVTTARPEERPAIAGLLSEAVMLNEMRMRATAPAAPAAETDRFIGVEDLARRMKLSKPYIYKHAEEWSFARRIGDALRFSERGLAAFDWNAWTRQRSLTAERLEG